MALKPDLYMQIHEVGEVGSEARQFTLFLERHMLERHASCLSSSNEAGLLNVLLSRSLGSTASSSTSSTSQSLLSSDVSTGLDLSKSDSFSRSPNESGD